MKSIYKTFGVVVSAALAAVSASCGDNGVNCGVGTKATNGSCVPDGSVVCTDGTKFNTEKGTCEIDPNACQDGTVLVNGKCQDPATVTPDSTEAAEPNDDVNPIAAGRITVPAIDAKGFVIKGCITPHRDIAGGQDMAGDPIGDGIKDADIDPWLLTVTGPTLLDVHSDGVRGLVAGFVFVSGDKELQDANYRRQGVSVVNDQANREIFLPKAGTYTLVMADSRTILKTAVGPGDANTCYYTTITQKKLPTATAVTAPTTPGTYSGKVNLYSATPQEGDFVTAQARPQSIQTFSGLVVMKNNAYASSSIETDTAFATVLAGGLKASDTITVVYDPDVVFSGQAIDYNLIANATHAQAFPKAGTTLNFTSTDGVLNSQDELSFTYLDVAAGEIDFISVATDKKITYTIVDSNLQPVATGTSSGIGGQLGRIANAKAADKDWFRFEKAGRYYVAFYAPTVTGAYTMTSSVFTTTLTALTLGTPLTGSALGDGGRNSAFATISIPVATKNWIATAAKGTNFAGANVRIKAYASNVIGRFDVDANTSEQSSIPVAGATRGTVLAGAAYDRIVRVADQTASAVNTKTFDLSVSDRVFTDLGTIAAPVTRAGETLTGAVPKLYFAKASNKSLFTAAVSPITNGLNLRIRTLTATEATVALVDKNAANGNETSSTTVADGWIAFEVSNATAVTGTATFDLTVSAAAPTTFTEICPAAGGAGALLAQTADTASTGPVGDESLTATQTLPFAFNMFGSAVTAFKVSSNGWLSFDGGLPNDARFANEALPTANNDANGFVAPFWTDLEGISICRLNGTGKMTIEWQGNVFGAPTAVASFQATLFADGHIDYAYGPTHVATGATVGVSSPDGADGITFAIPTTSSSSFSLFPQ
jgi:hypothetical protein